MLSFHITVLLSHIFLPAPTENTLLQILITGKSNDSVQLFPILCQQQSVLWYFQGPLNFYFSLVCLNTKHIPSRMTARSNAFWQAPAGQAQLSALCEWTFIRFLLTAITGQEGVHGEKGAGNKIRSSKMPAKQQGAEPSNPVPEPGSWPLA